MRILGIDPGSSLSGWAAVDFFAAKRPQYINGGHTDNDADWKELFHKAKPDLIVIEGLTYQGFRRSGRYVLETAWQGGKFEGLAHPAAIVITASAWRLALFKKNNPSDQQIRDFCMKEISKMPVLLKKHQHIYDSAALCVAAERTQVV